MQQENIRYVLVWSGWLRLSHWLIAAGVLFQVFSAWALRHETGDYSFWLDWHLITGQVVAMALGLRLLLLFIPVSSKQPGSGNWRALIPESSQYRAIVQMVKFYLSFTRFPLPNWHAHNPFWQPLYLVFFLLLAACLATGLLYDSPRIFLSLPMYKLHDVLANLIIIFSVFHIVTVFLHDLKGKGAFISAMVNGYRYFHYSSQSSVDSGKYNSSEKQKSVSISVDSIEKQTSK